MAFLAAALAVDGWFVWQGISGAVAQIKANDGIHGTYRPASCDVTTMQAEPITTKNGTRPGRTSYLIGCRGTFTADGGPVLQDVAYSASQQLVIGAPLPANVADLRSRTAYASGGGYGLDLFVAGSFLLLPVLIVLGGRRRLARSAPRSRASRSRARRRQYS
jgi:hypothetical protein